MFVALIAALLGTLLSVFLPAPRADAAAAIQEVTGFGTNPGALKMYRYVPDGLPAGRPVVVALHGCTQNASGYGTGSGWTELADRWGFSVVLPQQQSANNASSCFNWFQAGDIERGQERPPPSRRWSTASSPTPRATPRRSTSPG